MADGLQGNVAPANSGASGLSGWMVAQLLLAALLIPAVDGAVEIYHGSFRGSLQSRLFLYSFSDFSEEHANILWVVQVGLVLNVVGTAAAKLQIRWGAILAAIFFLLCQDGSYNYPGAIYLSLAAVAGVWLIWDPGPLGWRMLIGTAVGFLLVAAHYAIFGRNVTALHNVLLVLHYLLVGGALLLFRALGWKLSPRGSAAVPAHEQSARFTFAQMLAWVTCCGFGLMLLRFIEFAAPHTMEGVNGLKVGDQELFSSLFIYALVAPLLCLVAAWASLSDRLFKYWLGILATVAVTLVGLECIGPSRFVNQPANAPLVIQLVGAFQEVTFVATSILLVAATPTAALLIYRAAGFRWTRGNSAPAG
jgi:hypothetical protein